LSATNPGSFDRFGSAVAMGPDLLVIGANLRDSAAGSNVGSAFLFTSSDGTWSQHQELTGRDQYAADTFGSAVAVSGPLVVVGAPLADLAGGNSGAVYVFAPDDTQPPTIVGTAPSLAASKILDAGTRSLLVEFSEPVLGGGNAANYRLQSAGPDGLLGTVDDLILPLSVTYSGTTASLVFPALPESVYRLTCATRSPILSEIRWTAMAAVRLAVTRGWISRWSRLPVVCSRRAPSTSAAPLLPPRR
jgi:hypothetical protein